MHGFVEIKDLGSKISLMLRQSYLQRIAGHFCYISLAYNPRLRPEIVDCRNPTQSVH